MAERRRRKGAQDTPDIGSVVATAKALQQEADAAGFGMPDEAVGSADTAVWAYWQPLPNAYWDAGVAVQQELLGSALQQAWLALQTQLGLAGLQHVGTPRVRFSVEVDTEAQP